MEKSLIFKARKWRRQFVFFRRCHRRANGASYCDVGNCQYMLFLIISFGFCKRESSSLFFVGFIVVVEEIYTSVACDFGDIWAYNACFLQLADCWFSCTMIRKLFFSLASRLVPAMDCFHYVTYGIFSLWFSLNRVFVIKFSVSFATVVEVFARQKTLREKPDTFLLQRTTHVAWNPCCLIWWKTCIFVHLMPNKCSCHNLHVVVTVFVLSFLFFIFFTFVLSSNFSFSGSFSSVFLTVFFS